MKFVPLFVMVTLCSFTDSAHADYAQEIRNHIQLIENRFLTNMELAYFKDMGVVARKADEADESDLTAEIIGTLLMRRMDDFITNQITEAEGLFEDARYDAVKIVQNLNRFDKFYQPTDEYKMTAGGQAFASEMIRLRQNAVDAFEGGCSKEKILDGLRALRRTGLFLTNTPEEITNLRELTNHLNCCLAWKPKIHYYEEIPFKSEYEVGTVVEEARLKLKTSPRLQEQASWTGDWIYKFKGREGVGEGVSTAVFDYQRGKVYADVKIGGSRLRSSGRINLPVMTAGETRQLDVEGSPVFPYVYFSDFVKLPVMGCRDA